MREDFCYVIRFWRDGSASEAWRASLENLRTGEQQRFADRDTLLSTLEGMLSPLPCSSDIQSREDD